MRRTTGILLAISLLATLTATAFAGGGVWSGTLTVTGNASDPGVVVAEGEATLMNYCWAGEPRGTARVVANTVGAVTVAVSPTTSDECGSVKLPAGSYEILWTRGTWDPVFPEVNDCGAGTVIGHVTVDANGYGGPTQSQPFNPGNPGTIQVCVNSAVHYGLQVPVEVVAESAPPTTIAPDECPEEDGGETTWESGDPSSRQLGSNLGAPPATGGPYDAHHIVPGKAARGSSARVKLLQYYVDINDADNGLWLDRIRHRCQHTNVYYDEVNSRIEQATDQTSLRDILRQIADEIRAGTFPR